MGPIVCCLDDTEGARRALDVARELATKLERELVLLHVEPPTAAPGIGVAVSGRERLAEEEMLDGEALLQGLADDADVGSAARRVAVGPAARSIVTICVEVGASLVVVGSHGRRGLRSALLGSVSSEVPAKAPCPCVTVPPGVAAGHAPAA